MQCTHRRHDISDTAWKILEKQLPGRAGSWGRHAYDKRQFINAVFWILRTGASWRDLPADLGSWKNTHRRFCRWRDKGIWEKLLDILAVDPDFKWLMIDASHIKVHQHGAGARGGNQAMERIKGGSIARYTWPWMRMVCRSEFLLQKVPQLIVHNLMVGMNATYLLADKAYDTNDLLEKIAEQNMQAVIPPKKNRVLLRTYDKDLYKLHHLVENAFLHLKR